MEEILDSVRRIVRRWTTTATTLTSDAAPGDSILSVASSNRFQVGDEVLIHDPLQYEVGFFVDEIVDDTHIRLSNPILYDWTVDQNSVLEKAINQMIVNGIYIGDPEVIPMYPAITVNGISKSSEWLTLESVTERYELEINVFVLESTHEDGYRFLLKMVDSIQHGLKRNIYPLVNDFSTTTLIADARAGDTFIKVKDSSIFVDKTRDEGTFPKDSFLRLFIEDQFKNQELIVRSVIDETTIEVGDFICQDYDDNDTILIQPKRFIYNSWPESITYGKIHKGSLLQAATIRWFAQEEELQEFRFQDTHLR